MPNLIGTAPNQVPTNGSLGNMAFQNKEAVSVDTLVTTGNVGIGTTSPINTSGYGGLTINGTTGGILSLTAGGTEYLRAFGRAADSWVYTTGSTPLVLGTNSAERMRIDSSGNLGIGTTSASSWRTRISNTTNQTLSLQNSAGTGTRIQLIDTNWGGEIEQNAGAMIFKIGGTTEAMRIASDGKVGLGTASPNRSLTVGNGGLIGLYDTGDANQATLQMAANGLEAYVGAKYIAFGTSSTERVRIASDGKVGIGTTGATALLDVNADTVRVRTAKTPASATATGNAGDICWDANYVYVCVATNTWKRSALSTW